MIVDVGVERGHRGQLLAGERARIGAMRRRVLGQVGADVAAQHAERQARRAGHVARRHAAWLCSSISSGCGQPFSTASRKRCSEPTPGLPPHENVSLRGAPGADQLVVDDVGRHPHQVQVAPALADDLVPGGVRDEVGEALERRRVAVVTSDGSRE